MKSMIDAETAIPKYVIFVIDGGFLNLQCTKQFVRHTHPTSSNAAMRVPQLCLMDMTFLYQLRLQSKFLYRADKYETLNKYMYRYIAHNRAIAKASIARASMRDTYYT